MLVSHEHDDSSGLRAQVWEAISDPASVVFALGGTATGISDVVDDADDIGTDI